MTDPQSLQYSDIDEQALQRAEERFHAQRTQEIGNTLALRILTVTTTSLAASIKLPSQSRY